MPALSPQGTHLSCPCLPELWALILGKASCVPAECSFTISPGSTFQFIFILKRFGVFKILANIWILIVFSVKQNIINSLNGNMKKNRIKSGKKLDIIYNFKRKLAWLRSLRKFLVGSKENVYLHYFLLQATKPFTFPSVSPLWNPNTKQGFIFF